MPNRFNNHQITYHGKVADKGPGGFSEPKGSPAKATTNFGGPVFAKLGGPVNPYVRDAKKFGVPTVKIYRIDQNVADTPIGGMDLTTSMMPGQTGAIGMPGQPADTSLISKLGITSGSIGNAIGSIGAGMGAQPTAEMPGSPQPVAAQQQARDMMALAQRR